MNREIKHLILLTIGIFTGLLLSNIHESIVHDVSFYDAVFIESWKGDGNE